MIVHLVHFPRLCHNNNTNYGNIVTCRHCFSTLSLGNSTSNQWCMNLPAGKMKHLEAEGKEIAIANINGNYYTFNDRCGQMCASLSMGVITENVATWAFHRAQFDRIMGKKVKAATLTAPPTEGLPDALKKLMEHNYKKVQMIKTYDQKTYAVAVDADRIKISL
jgi:nitrite reductase/ring-hydroxylating ferredoxin subunit